VILLMNLNYEEIAKDVLLLQKEAYGVEAELIGFDDLPPLRDDIYSLMRSEEIFYGYYEADELVGMISYVIENNIMDIYRLAVKPKVFRKGIAEKLIEHIMKKNEKIKEMIVSTGAGNEPAIRLYQKWGFRKIGETEVEKGLKVVNFTIEGSSKF